MAWGDRRDYYRREGFPAETGFVGVGQVRGAARWGWVKNMIGDSQIVIRAARAAREFCQKMCD